MTEESDAIEEFEDRDLSGAVFWGVLLRDAMFRDVDFTGTRTHHVLLRDVEFDGFVDRLVVNGVDVTDHVNANDPWQPLRGMLQPATADEVRAAWTETERVWDETLDRAARLSSEQRRRRVDGEWSLMETLRHLLFANDKWCIAPLAGGSFSSIGMPNTGSVGFDWPGLDRDAEPTDDEILEARRHQHEVIAATVGELTDARLDERVEVMENGTVRVLDCWHTVLEEAFEHRRYALRDLDRLLTEPGAG